jgi:predicted transposase YdaD
MLATRVEEWKQQWLREGEQRGELRGEQRGEQKGRQSGEADLLLHLLEHRFGDLPSAAKDRVQAADTAMIKKWASRVLDAASLNEVLDDITT